MRVVFTKLAAEELRALDATVQLIVRARLDRFLLCGEGDVRGLLGCKGCYRFFAAPGLVLLCHLGPAKLLDERQLVVSMVKGKAKKPPSAV